MNFLIFRVAFKVSFMNKIDKTDKFNFFPALFLTKLSNILDAVVNVVLFVKIPF